MKTKLAIGAVAAMLAMPAFAQDRDWTIPWLPAPSGKMIEMINGNDFRDNRDSTLSRNDVPLDQTTLSNASDQSWRSSDAARDSSMSESHMSASPANSAEVPATAATEDHTPTTSGPAIEYSAQQNQTIINETPEPSLAAEHTLAQDSVAPEVESEVTARNPSGIEAVQDRTERDVYTGIEGAGGTAALSAEQVDGQERMTQ